MLGRHVYRVSPRENGEWGVHKDGEPKARGSRPSREQAAQLACDLAAQDEPSKVVVEAASGARLPVHPTRQPVAARWKSRAGG
jgi:hypothetical protein